MLFGRKKKEKEAEISARKKAELLAEKAALQEEIRKLEEERKKLLETQKPKEPFVVPEMEAADLENYAIKLKIEGRTEEAFACVQKAAERGSCSSQYKCGEKALENGDFEKAVFWFQKAAKQDHFGAIVDFSKLIIEGKAKMTESFFAVISEKAKYDDAIGCYYLGFMHYFGKGTEKDLPKAYYLIEKSKLLDFQKRAAEPYSIDDHLEKIKSDYISENGPDSIYKFYKKISDMYASETGSISYKEKAVEYMKKSFKPVKVNIEFEPGEEVYIDGIEAANEGRYEEAFKLYRKAVDLGYTKALAKIAYCCINGEGVPKNLEAARLFAIAGAKHGDVDCKIILYHVFNESV